MNTPTEKLRRVNIWRNVESDRPADGATIVTIHYRPKLKGPGWHSVDLMAGEVCSHDNGSWYVFNNDGRGNGSEMRFADTYEAPSGYETFSYWCYQNDLPALPEVT